MITWRIYKGVEREGGGAYGEICINGRFVYTAKHNPVKDGHARTDAYIYDPRRLDARFCVRGFQEAVGPNASPQHHSYRV